MREDKLSKQGFTLVELSVVLVIIGLIIGAVLMGRDMVAGAEIRAAITEIQRYQTAVKTFRGKFGGLPGDINAQDAQQLGMEARASHGSGVINSNNIIETTSDDTNNESTTVSGHEAMLFWRDLSYAQLTGGDRFATATDATVPAPSGVTAKAQVDLYIPRLKGLTDNSVALYSSLGLNYFAIAKVDSVASGGYTIDYGLNPQNAFSIDQKIDDGKPITGIVRGARSANTLGTQCSITASGGDGDACCGDGNAGNSNQYKMLDSAGAPNSSKTCQLSVRL